MAIQLRKPSTHKRVNLASYVTHPTLPYMYLETHFKYERQLMYPPHLAKAVNTPCL